MILRPSVVVGVAGIDALGGWLNWSSLVLQKDASSGEDSSENR